MYPSNAIHIFRYHIRILIGSLKTTLNSSDNNALMDVPSLEYTHSVVSSWKSYRFGPLRDEHISILPRDKWKGWVAPPRRR
jgi:hypothetical protein